MSDRPRQDAPQGAGPRVHMLTLGLGRRRWLSPTWPRPCGRRRWTPRWTEQRALSDILGTRAGRPPKARLASASVWPSRAMLREPMRWPRVTVHIRPRSALKVMLRGVDRCSEVPGRVWGRGGERLTRVT